MSRSVKIAFGAAEERIPESQLRRFVDGLSMGIPTLSLEHRGESHIAVLEDAAAMAPSLAAEVLGLRAVIHRAITEGCPKAGRHCAWCGTDLTPAKELHHRECPWLALVNASSWLDRFRASQVLV